MTLPNGVIPDNVFSVVNERYLNKYVPRDIKSIDEHQRRVLDSAIWYAEQGVPVFPVDLDKRPLTPNGFKDATTDTDQVRIWFKKERCMGIGLPTGQRTGIWVLDVDGEAGERSLKALEDKHEPLPTSCVQRTGGGGRQFIFRCPEGSDIRNSASQIEKNLDVRGEGGYVVIPPSISSKLTDDLSRGLYEWLDTSHIPDAPQWLIELVTEPPSGSNGRGPNGNGGGSYVFEDILQDGTIPDGKRDTTLNAYAWKLANMGMPEEEATVLVGALDEQYSEYPGGKDRTDKSTIKIVQRGYSDYRRKGNGSTPPPHDGEEDMGGWLEDHGYINLRKVREEGIPPVKYLIDGVIPEAHYISLFGDSGVGKTFTALGWAADALKRGLSVLYLDFENTFRTIGERLMALGVSDEELDNFHYYYSPATDNWEDFSIKVREYHKPSLTFVDSQIGLLGAMSLSEDKKDDISKFETVFVKPLQGMGGGIVVLDHPNHTEKNRPSGSIRKEQGVDILYKQTGGKITPDNPVEVKLTNLKDRKATLPIGHKESHIYRMGGSPFEHSLMTAVYPSGLTKNEGVVYDHIRRRTLKDEGDRKKWMYRDLKSSMSEKTIDRICQKLSDEPYNLLYKNFLDHWRVKGVRTEGSTPSLASFMDDVEDDDDWGEHVGDNPTATLGSPHKRSIEEIIDDTNEELLRKEVDWFSQGG